MIPKRVVFLMSDTGGGHRAAAGAIRAAMERRYPGAYTFELVDVYRRYTPFPMNLMPEIYPRWVNWAAASWELSFRLADGRRRSALVMAAINRWWGRGMRRLVDGHRADVVVSVHTLFSRPAMHAYNRWHLFRPPFVSVVTDLVSAHAFAYEKDADRCLLPTPAAYARGLALGLESGRLRVTGLPIHPRFLDGLAAKADARRQLGWHPDRAAVLISGGADGMGPVFQIARAIDRLGLDIQLAIVAGRNRRLKHRLEAAAWRGPTFVYPFLDSLAGPMAAADVLVTKAGPATICEACAAGLPMVLSGAVPGQEDGNVTYVVENGAGVYAPSPELAAAAVHAWLARGPAFLAERARCARALARPDAVWQIADEIHQQAHRPPVRTRLGAQLEARRPALRQAPEDGWVL